MVNHTTPIGLLEGIDDQQKREGSAVECMSNCTSLMMRTHTATTSM
jgi:hypothetical protein